jgi:hypothetical protein
MAYQWFITAWANHQPTTTRATQQPTAPMINQLPIDPQDLRNAVSVSPNHSSDRSSDIYTSNATLLEIKC